MLHIISMYRPDDPTQTVVSDFSKVIPCLMAPGTLVVRARQHNHSAIAAPNR
jgi:hypothetical protein